MSYISFEFIVLVLGTCLLYYLLPMRFRWIIILSGSIIFYSTSGIQGLIVALAEVLIAFGSARKISRIYQQEDIDNQTKRKKAKVYLMTGVILLIIVLIYTKTIGMATEALKAILSGETLTMMRIIPLGISYYTFALIGYMADVYWKKTTAETNYLKLLLYALYFPQIVEGPIPRHKKMQNQLTEGHVFDYEQFCFGIQRVGWGLIKKMIIADRAAVLVNEVFGNYTSYTGLYFVVALVLSAAQLYCDFSGCMDIAIGISQMLGITLDENFQRPFAAASAAEFWRRWHITLGTWFKDYVYMPVAINPHLINLSKKVRETAGVRTSKAVISVSALLCVWILTGVWHGTGLGYVLWGLYWGVIIIISTVFKPEIRELNKKLKINEKSVWWLRWQKFRTFLIFLGGRFLTVPGTMAAAGYAFVSIWKDHNPWILVDGSLYSLGLNRANVWCMLFFLAILNFISGKQEKGIHIRKSIAEFPIVFRWGLYLLMVAAILVFGMYGPGYDASSFLYAQY